MPQDKAPESTPSIDLSKDSEPPPPIALKSTRVSSSKMKATTTPVKTETEAAKEPLSPAVVLMKSVLPLTPGSDNYATIFKDVTKSFSLPEYSGALAFWLLWKLGCRDRELMCRDEPEDFIKFVPDAAGPKVWKGGKSPFHRFALGETPTPGDVLFLTNGPPETELLAVFLGVAKKAEKGDDGIVSTPVWSIALVKQDGTVFTADAVECEIKVRTMCERAVMGWLPVSELELTPAK